MKNGLSGVRVGLAAALAFGLSHATFAATELTVYTAVEAEDLKKYAARFNEDHPDIKINWVRDSTGIVTAKLLAEKEKPCSYSTRSSGGRPTCPHAVHRALL